MDQQPFVSSYTQFAQGQQWLQRYQGKPCHLGCVVGFTETGLIPGISAAGVTPNDRRYTALADAEFLCNGPRPDPVHALPQLADGISPTVISRSLLAAAHWPLILLNAGLPEAPAFPCIDLASSPARCLSTGQAMELALVHQLFQQGLAWGDRLAKQAIPGYLVLGECVVGGTTSALALLTGLGIEALGKVNSSHPHCNHQQKWSIVQAGLQKAGWSGVPRDIDPLKLIAAVGDPMQPVVAGMAIAGSLTTGILLAGGTQMLAVYALAAALAQTHQLNWQPEQVMVGTTRWVVEDPTGDTIALAHAIGDRFSGLIPTLLATPLNFAHSRYPQLCRYEQGYVKEGVGAGGCAIAASLHLGWGQQELLQQIEQLVDQMMAIDDDRASTS